VTVIDIDAIQYARIEIGGLFVILETGRGNTAPLLDAAFAGRKGSRWPKSRISCDSAGILTVKSSFFLSSMVKEGRGVSRNGNAQAWIVRLLELVFVAARWKIIRGETESLGWQD
jgi:hypothetical protein